MPISDNIVTGQPIIDSSNFGEGFTSKFNTLNLNRDFGKDPTPGATDGMWKRGFYLSNITEAGSTWGSDSPFGPAQINQEQMWFKDPKYRHPYDQSGLEINQDGLVMHSRVVDQRSTKVVAAAKVKGFEEDINGALGDFVLDLPVPYNGEMLSTYGRFSMSFGECEARLRMPYGVLYDPVDFRKIQTCFPAWWLLENVPYGRGADGNFTPDGSTYMPAKFNLGGIMTEHDIVEIYGYERNTLHQTLHYTKEGSQNNFSSSFLAALDFDPYIDWFIAGVHKTPEKIGYYLNGFYTHVLNTPDEVKLGMREVIMDPQQWWLPTGFSANFQTHDNSANRRYRQDCLILNFSRSSSFTRGLSRIHHDNGFTLPPHHESCQMFVDYCHAKPLLVDNPDTMGMTVRGQYIPTNSGGWSAYT